MTRTDKRQAGCRTGRGTASPVGCDMDTDLFLVVAPSEGGDANWHVTNNWDTCVAHCFGFAHDIQTGELLARRIAAALNACRGISTEQLEKRG